MGEIFGKAFGLLFGEVISVWVIGGFLKLVHNAGVRIYSLFAGTRKTPVAELRLKYDHLVMPWIIGFSIFGTVLYFGFTWLVI